MMTRPHIVVFLTDDHGQWASGCYGNTELCTPSMDWLAGTGARMTEAYTPCPVCSPARASFWTGRIPSAHGIHDHIGLAEHPGITGQTTLAQRLQHSGYRTGLCGKWHCHAHGNVPRPGFDAWFSQWGGTNAKAGPQPFSDNGQRRDFRGHQAPIITDAALRFMRSHADDHADQPMFLFIGYTDTHAPFATLPERLVERYRQARFDDIPDERHAALHGRPRWTLHRDQPDFRESLAQYYASVALIDEQVGRVLDELDAMGVLDETLVVYTADHGHMNGHHGLLTKGNATIPQSFLDESIRVPLMARWPGTIQAGMALEAPVDHCDLHATLLEASGAAAADDDPRAAGRSFLPLLRGEPIADWRDSQVVEYGNARMIRTAAGLKLIRRFPGPNGTFPDALFDLRSDPRETRNLIDDPTQAQAIGRLDALLREHFERREDPDRAGTGVGSMDRFNNAEPWRLDPNG